MNMKYKFDRRLVITISVLLTALWLPLTTFAEDLSEASEFQNLQDCEKSHNVLSFSPDSNSQVQEESVGFSETDPAVQQSRNVGVFLFASNNQVRQEYVGFAETDPTGQQSQNNPQTSNRLVQGGDGGFSESDPAADILFKLTDKGSSHEHC